MAYQRKTKDEHQLLASYDGGLTWEVETSEDTSREIKKVLKTYRENCHTGIYRTRMVRVKI